MRGRSLSVLEWAASYLTGVLVRVSRWRHPSNQRRRCGTFWNYLPRRASSATLDRLGFALLLAADSHESGLQYSAAPSISSTGRKYLYMERQVSTSVGGTALYRTRVGNTWGRSSPVAFAFWRGYASQAFRLSRYSTAIGLQFNGWRVSLALKCLGA